MIVLLVCVVGGLGAATRFVVDGWIRGRGRWARVSGLPIATIAVNTSGSLFIGVLAGGLATGAITPDLYAVGAAGFCGGYTTFSTSMVETVRLAQAGAYRRAATNAFGTLGVTVAAVALGVALGGLLPA